MIFCKKKQLQPTVVAIRHVSYDNKKMLEFCMSEPFYQYHSYDDSVLGKIIIPNTVQFISTYYHERSRRGSALVRAKFKPLMDSLLVDDDEYVQVVHDGKTEWVKSVHSPT